MANCKKVLVTGATGHIGSSAYLALAAKEDQYEVHGLDRQRTFSQRVPQHNKDLQIPDERFHLADLADYSAIQRAVTDMDVVVHLGADPGDDGSWESLLNNNLIGTYNVFAACKEARVQRIVAASSIMVSDGHRKQEPYKSIYDKRFDDVPVNFPMISPEIPAEPRGLYGATKVWAESLARVYRAYPRSVVHLHPHRPGRTRPAAPTARPRYFRQPARYRTTDRMLYQRRRGIAL